MMVRELEQIGTTRNVRQQTRDSSGVADKPARRGAAAERRTPIINRMFCLTMYDVETSSPAGCASIIQGLGVPLHGGSRARNDGMGSAASLIKAHEEETNGRAAPHRTAPRYIAGTGPSPLTMPVGFDPTLRENKVESCGIDIDRYRSPRKPPVTSEFGAAALLKPLEMKRLSVSNAEGICKQALFALRGETRQRMTDARSKYSGSVTTVMDNWKSRAIDTIRTTYIPITRGLADHSNRLRFNASRPRLPVIRLSAADLIWIPRDNAATIPGSLSDRTGPLDLEVHESSRNHFIRAHFESTYLRDSSRTPHNDNHEFPTAWSHGETTIVIHTHRDSRRGSATRARLSSSSWHRTEHLKNLMVIKDEIVQVQAMVRRRLGNGIRLLGRLGRLSGPRDARSSALHRNEPSSIA
ncbi:hypothetical protein DBV15_04349 [Temnothorax longispinosus]|uniref:Uncharacterized protein n=1 Tax=Temnothorax longispinosus TaxID=300112 RepID=A0A4S2K3H4_9HYME|nr:hypothetical protein DBV15_04349 [Temnothorax longispinosus]